MILRRLGAATIVALSVSSSALPACSETANVSEVWMSIDDDGARRRSTFFTDSSAVVCVAEIGVGRTDVTVEMLIRKIRGAPFGTKDFDAENTVVVGIDFRPELTQGKPGKATLKMVPSKIEEGKIKEDPEAPFNPGSYICEVRVDGELKGEAAFNIDYPDCPVVNILQDQPCAGFYSLDPVTVCPQAGLTGDRDPTCTCELKGWNCR